MPINNNILNQKGTPAFYSDIFANRPAFGYAGRVFISTDTGAIYEDTGTAWTLIADAGAGTTGTLQQVTTNGNTTTLGISVQGIDINDGAGTGGANTALGNISLGVNTTGSSNTAVGSSALSLNTTGNSNTGIGSLSLQKNTTGISNTALGLSSLQNNTTGQINTAIGTNSLLTNTTGSYNVGVGLNSLFFNTTGQYNSAVGTYSLQENTTGANNTAVGYASMTQNTTASNNTAIGYSSLNLNTTGIQNTAIGRSALEGNLTGNGNVAIGYNSLTQNSSASNNTAIGQSSLTAITTGTLNTAIGYLSGSAITTGSNNTILGAYAGTTTLASNIVLSDGAGNVRLYSNSAGLIGINQAVGTPSAQLDIHTTATYGLGVNGTGTSNAYLGFANAGTFKWRIGNTYNAGANSFDIFNLTTSATALKITSVNNMGIGVTPSAWGTGYIGVQYGTAGSQMSVANNNRVGLNFYFDGAAFRTIQTGTSSFIEFDGDNIFFKNAASVAANAAQTLNTRLLIADTGNVLIGSTTDNGVKLQVNGTATINNATGFGALDVGGQLNATTQNVCRLGNISGVNNGLIIQLNSSNNYIYNFGTLGTGSVVATANVLSATSDMNLKIADGFIENALDKVLKILPRYFYWKGETGMPTNLRQLGFFAQEINECLGEEVANAPKNNNEKWGIYDRGMIAMLVKAIQELNEKLVRNNIN